MDPSTIAVSKTPEYWHIKSICGEVTSVDLTGAHNNNIHNPLPCQFLLDSMEIQPPWFLLASW